MYANIGLSPAAKPCLAAVLRAIHSACDVSISPTPIVITSAVASLCLRVNIYRYILETKDI